jgi:hypothetical protein
VTEKAEADVKESIQVIEEYERQVKKLLVKYDDVLEEVDVRWEENDSQKAEVVVSSYKKDIVMELFSVDWFPYSFNQIGGQILDLKGYSGGVKS